MFFCFETPRFFAYLLKIPYFCGVVIDVFSVFVYSHIIMNNIKAVLFDLDGVLIDTESIYTRFWDDINLRYPTGIDNFALHIKGSTLTTILDKYFPDPAVQDELRRLLRENEENMPYVLFDGASDVLSRLRSAGIAIAIVTSSNRVKMDHVFAAIPELAEKIETLVTDEDVTISKPDPQGYLLAASRLGVGPESFVVVEDSISGLEAGRRAGGKVIGIATTNPRSRIEPLADFVVDTVAGLKELF